jgi:hypothetical protein
MSLPSLARDGAAESMLVVVMSLPSPAGDGATESC